MKRLFRQSQRESTGLDVAALAPMVDLFTLLVIAVLRSSSPEAPLELPEEKLLLPISTLERSPASGITIDVGQEGLYVDGWRAGSASFWNQSDQLLIRDLYESLQQYPSGHIKIRAHSESQWQLVNKVLLTCQQAGFKDIELVGLSNTSL